MEKLFFINLYHFSYDVSKPQEGSFKNFLPLLSFGENSLFYQVAYVISS